MSRFMVPLKPETSRELRELAKTEHRDIRDQAALLINEALVARRQQTERAVELRLVVSVDGNNLNIKPEVQYAA